MKRTHLRFSINYFTVVSKIDCTLKIDETVNLTMFTLFSFLQLRNIKGTYSKYFQNNISETDILSAGQLSIT